MDASKNVDVSKQKLDIRSMEQAEKLVDAFSEISEQEQVLYKIVNSIMENKANRIDIGGNADAFHNFSVSILKIASDYATALEIVQLGLTIHPSNTDLLADAIRYGYNCGKAEDCKKWFDDLKKIETTSWTWRAFSFAIDYLLEVNASDITNTDTDETMKELLALVKKYQECWPDEEDSRFSEFEIYNRTNQKSKAYDVLSKAIADIKICPKCWLRYADIMVDRGEYEKAVPAIKNLCNNYLISADSVNMGYVFYLRGICQMALLSKDDTDDPNDLFSNIKYDPQKVEYVYDSFRLALTQDVLRENLKAKIIEKLNNIKEITGCDYPAELKKVLDKF